LEESNRGVKIRYRGEYYIACDFRHVDRVTPMCRAWRYRTGREITDVTLLKGIAQAVHDKRYKKKGRKSNEQ
jgi:hypothetical protein